MLEQVDRTVINLAAAFSRNFDLSDKSGHPGLEQDRCRLQRTRRRHRSVRESGTEPEIWMFLSDFGREPDLQ